MGNQSSVMPSSPSTNTTKGFQPIKGFQPVERGSIDWQKNTKECTDDSCFTVFSPFKRPHHCRVCGNVFCGRCAPKRHLYHDNRACKDCTTKALESVKNELLRDAQKRTYIGST